MNEFIYINTERKGAIRLGSIIKGEISIAIGEFETTPKPQSKTYFSYSAKDVIDIHHAKQIIEHLQKEFKL